MAQAEQMAAEKLRQDYWQAALQKGMQEQLRADSRTDHASAADALAKYRGDTLDLRSKELAKRSEPKAAQFHKSGEDIYYGSTPEDFKVVVQKEKVPSISASLKPNDPLGAKGTFPMNHPYLNTPGVLDPVVAKMAGTNYQSRMNVPSSVAPSPVSNSTPIVSPDEAEDDGVMAAAIEKLKRAPSKRAEILKRLKDAGYSTEGL